MASTLSATALSGLPEIAPGDDLASVIASRLRDSGLQGGLRHEDVLVVAHKVVSKAEGRICSLSEVEPSERAHQLAQEHHKDPRQVQVILEQSDELLRASHGVLICLTPHGFVCANAGVDASNVADRDHVVLLPLDPDASARALRGRLRALLGTAPAVVITDSFGRAWRHGQCDQAIGCAGIQPLEDWRGRRDAHGRELHATWIAVADELAAAADLARAKDGSQPVVVVRGAAQHVRSVDGPGAAAMIRPASEDLFR